MESDPTSPEALRAKLGAELDLVPWQELRSHALADRLFLVAADLEVLEVAVAIACDDSAAVSGWIEGGSLARPSGDELNAFDGEPGRELRCVIVQPFVLAQRVEAGD